MKIKLAVIGGFLGAGKTACILQLAKRLQASGRRFGIVTNDQGSVLADTQFLAGEGLPVLEVSGGCFCCNFEEFVARLDELAETVKPDIVLAEPVGSCTDLVATLFKPMMAMYTEGFALLPFTVVVDPRRLRKLMMAPEESPFPDEINYLFRKQLEEADLIVLNKTDLLTCDEARVMVRYLGEEFPGAVVTRAAVQRGEGVAELLPLVLGGRFTEKPSLDLDYGIYGRAEAMLGWLNSSHLLRAKAPVDFNQFLRLFFARVREGLGHIGGEIAHLKVYGVTDREWTKAGLTGNGVMADFSRELEHEAEEMSLVINARICMPPEDLRRVVQGTLEALCGEWGIEMDEGEMVCFRPAEPRPGRRICK